jgi:molybdenum cofactor guanylyltransferase
MIADCTALILAGGESRRMGQDKASLLLGEQTLLQRVTEIVQPLFSEIIVSTRERRADCDLPQVFDAPMHFGPLAGLAAGLESIKTPWMFAVACDMPFITPHLIENIASHRDDFDAVVPVFQGYPQPLAAFYATRIKHELRDVLQGGGKRSLRELLARLHVCYVDEAEILEADHAGFFDLDTPEDMKLAIKKVNQWNT